MHMRSDTSKTESQRLGGSVNTMQTVVRECATDESVSAIQSEVHWPSEEGSLHCIIIALIPPEASCHGARRHLRWVEKLQIKHVHVPALNLKAEKPLEKGATAGEHGSSRDNKLQQVGHACGRAHVGRGGACGT